MGIDTRHAPATVATGLLTQAEFNQLSQEDQGTVERETVRLRSKYGDEWLKTQQPRLRKELSFFYGV